MDATYPIGLAIDKFSEDVNSIFEATHASMMLLSIVHREAFSKYDAYVKKNNLPVAKEDDKEIISVEAEHRARFDVLERRVKRSSAAQHIIPKSGVVALVSVYDAFVGQLVRTLLTLHPRMLNSSDRVLTFAQLSEFKAIDDARNFVLEKEIESLLRESHPEQFQILEKRFDIKLRVDLPVWPTFVEVTERRNLFVHCDGIVSNQYLSVCKEHKCPLAEDLKVGNPLEVDSKYFSLAYECIYEIGVKLGQVLWRKSRPEELAAADRNLQDICFGLISEKKYRLAAVLLDFACLTLKKHSDDRNRLVFVVNRAQAYKWSGDEKKATEIITSQDWSARALEFQLAAKVLQNSFLEAAEIMKRIGANGSPRKSSYRDWPLFKEFRKTDEFKTTYKELFGEDLQFKKEATELGESDKPKPGGPPIVQ